MRMQKLSIDIFPSVATGRTASTRQSTGSTSGTRQAVRSSDTISNLSRLTYYNKCRNSYLSIGRGYGFTSIPFSTRNQRCPCTINTQYQPWWRRCHIYIEGQYYIYRLGTIDYTYCRILIHRRHHNHECQKSFCDNSCFQWAPNSNPPISWW